VPEPLVVYIAEKNSASWIYLIMKFEIECVLPDKHVLAQIIVGFVEVKVTLGWGSFFGLFVPSHQCPILIHSSATHTV
jgi:hypothetical protein